MRLALVGLAVLLATPVAANQTKPSQKRRYRLKLGAGWTRVEPPAASTKLATHVLEAHHHKASGRRLVITRTNFPNHGARKQLRTFAKNLERGLRKQPGYKRLRLRTRRLRRHVARIDLTFRRTGEVVMMRFILYRSSSLALTLITPAKRWRRWRTRNRRLLQTFHRR